jgi:hypothetical protein
MTAPHADQLIDGYLARLRLAATDLPPSVRDELIDDMRAHVTEARARESEETDATILNILDRLGEPEAVVTEAARRPDVFGSGQPSERPESYRPGILEIAALVLLPFLWPVGVVLLWISPAWKIRDKVVGTVLPPGGYPGLLYLGLFLGHAVAGHTSACVASGDSSGVVTQVCSGPNIVDTVGTVLSVAFVIVLWLLPVITAAYLGIRLRWGRGRRVAATA